MRGQETETIREGDKKQSRPQPHTHNACTQTHTWLKLHSRGHELGHCSALGREVVVCQVNRDFQRHQGCRLTPNVVTRDRTHIIIVSPVANNQDPTRRGKRENVELSVVVIHMRIEYFNSKLQIISAMK